MAKGNITNSSSQKLNNVVDDLKKQLAKMENKVHNPEVKNKTLEEKVERLESKVVISEIVSKRLENELDRLNQYHRRSNIIIKNVFPPEKETNVDVTIKVTNILSNDLNLPDVIGEIDKLHRVGKIKDRNGKQNQDRIVKFKSHSARYKVYKERKRGRTLKYRPILLKKEALFCTIYKKWKVWIELTLLLPILMGT